MSLSRTPRIANDADPQPHSWAQIQATRPIYPRNSFGIPKDTSPVSSVYADIWSADHKLESADLSGMILTEIFTPLTHRVGLGVRTLEPLSLEARSGGPRTQSRRH